MLGTPSLWFSRRRARGAGSVCITAVALWAAVACGSDGDSPGPIEGDGGDQGSGGTGPSSGGTDSTGGAGGAPTDGGGGETSTDGGGSGGGSSASGDFSSIWQATSAELMFIDPANAAGFESHTLEIPAKVEGPDGREVELYLQFEGESRITYAYTEGDSAYYRFLQPASSFGDFYSVQGTDGSHSYSIEDGKLTDIAQQSFGSAYSAITTTSYQKAEEFPPSDWPGKVVTYELEGAQ